jgi:hypothetical protein
MRKIFTLLLVSLFTLAASAQNASFEEFLSQFPKASLPYSLSQEALRSQLEQRAGNQPVERPKLLEWQFYEFLPALEEDARTNRMPVYPEPVVALENETHYAVIYNTGRNFARQYKTYNIAVFEKNGKLVATRCIGGVNPVMLATAHINKDFIITIEEFSINWAKNYSTHGIEGNSILGLTRINTRIVKATASVDQPSENWRNNPEQLETNTLPEAAK